MSRLKKKSLVPGRVRMFPFFPLLVLAVLMPDDLLLLENSQQCKKANPSLGFVIFQLELPYLLKAAHVAERKRTYFSFFAPA